ncbi:STAS/SEC14 domain-containing protein [Rhodoligotrophos defluvii]|uniref:STAS/SEC14 domain-containing protein n=1 Tax=Rhodoligotrophos defluvii TaxID=2561934 RepID=UPI0010C9AF98|nr:STAS/SEC14 domain-containing protein [Rhodoligotrophos defluvii]
MIDFMKESNGDIVGIRATGKLTGGDYSDVLVSWLEGLIQRYGTLRVLFYMDEDFRGWDLHAAWANTELDFKFRSRFERVAIVGAPAWEEWCVRLASLVVKGELRLFKSYQLAEAWEWLRAS